MKKLLLLFLLFFVWACASQERYVHLLSAEEQMVKDCQYLDTLSETLDPGRFLPKYRANDAEREVLQRADQLGATHIVWIHNYHRLGSAAMAYRCGGSWR